MMVNLTAWTFNDRFADSSYQSAINEGLPIIRLLISHSICKLSYVYLDLLFEPRLINCSVHFVTSHFSYKREYAYEDTSNAEKKRRGVWNVGRLQTGAINLTG